MPDDPIVNNLAICPTCLRTLLFVGAAARLATGAETTVLSDHDLGLLKQARKKAREAQG